MGLSKLFAIAIVLTSLAIARRDVGLEVIGQSPLLASSNVALYTHNVLQSALRRTCLGLRLLQKLGPSHSV